MLPANAVAAAYSRRVHPRQRNRGRLPAPVWFRGCQKHWIIVLALEQTGRDIFPTSRLREVVQVSAGMQKASVLIKAIQRRRYSSAANSNVAVTSGPSQARPPSSHQTESVLAPSTDVPLYPARRSHWCERRTSLPQKRHPLRPGARIERKLKKSEVEPVAEFHADPLEMPEILEAELDVAGSTRHYRLRCPRPLRACRSDVLFRSRPPLQHCRCLSAVDRLSPDVKKPQLVRPNSRRRIGRSLRQAVRLGACCHGGANWGKFESASVPSASERRVGYGKVRGRPRGA